MTTKVVFETATIADAIKAANKVAPAKAGSAFDQAAGIIIEPDPATDTAVVRASNGDLFYMAWVDTLSVEGPPAMWRLPSRVLTAVLSSLPIGTGRTVTFEQKDRGLHMTTTGRTKASFVLINPDSYPLWEAFDPDGLFLANDLGGKIALVEWAAAKTEIPFSGVYFDGKQVVATDRYRMARVPLEIPDLENPVTVPAGILSQVIKQTGEVRIGVEQGGEGSSLLIMPDEHTQIRSVVFGQQYPPIDKIMRREYPETVQFDKDELLTLIGRTSAFESSSRTPVLRMFLGGEEIRVMMSDEGKGMLGDVLEVPGYCKHDRIEIRFTPKNLVDPLTQAPNQKVTFSYDPGRLSGLLYINGGSGWESWIMPLLEKAEKSA